MRIMQLYRIEYDYKRHKKRLENIKKSNSKDKISRLTHQHFYMTNQHFKMKNNADQFREKQELLRREHDLLLRNNTIETYSKKIKSQVHEQVHSQRQQKRSRVNSLPRHIKLQKIDQELKKNHEKEKQKWDKVKSVYGGYRLSQEREASKRTNSKDKILNLLKNHFHLDGKVLYPQAKSKKNNSITISMDPSPKDLDKIFDKK